MALDQQRNWNVSMAENLRKIQLRAQRDREEARGRQNVKDHTPVRLPVPEPFTGPPVHLPDEIITIIVDFVCRQSDAQKTLASCCLLSHQWYSVSVSELYRSPALYGKNFDPFARTICPSINLHVRKSPLSSLVHHLDLGGLVHQGSRSVTARLLGRTKANMESFRAPQASFAINCLPALARCSKLKSLDLSLVSESPPLPELLKAVSSLQHLVSFRLPRSTGFGSYDGQAPIRWPPHLQSIALSGGIDDWFLRGAAKFPDTLSSMTIEHCPMAKSYLVKHFIANWVGKLPGLESFKISNMPRFSAFDMNNLLYDLPNVRRLSVSVDYITPAFFEDRYEDVKLQHPKLHTLELTNSGNPSVDDKITPIDLLIAVDDDVLPALRVVRVAKSLFWQSGEAMSDAEALADALQTRGVADWESRSGVFATMPTEQWKAADPSSMAGVWSFSG